VSGLSCTPANGSSLAPGSVMTCTAAHTVVQADIDAGHYLNTACVDDGAAGAPQACAPRDVPGIQNPLIDIQKTALTPIVVAGASASFSITVTNTGNVTLSNVVVTDPLAPLCNRTIGTMAPGATTTYTCLSGPVTTGFVNVATATGTPTPGGGTVTDNDDAVVSTPTAQIAPTATSCQMFRDGTSADLNALLYNLKSGNINSVAPGVFFYYSTIVVAAGNTITVNQTDNGSTPSMSVQQGQAYLWSLDCTRALTGTSAPDGSTVTFVAPATATYIIGIKYTPENVKGSPDPGTVTYSFSSSINGAPVAASADSIDLKKK
jgi:uncharacterized repeat protein (TIGR01451 family)